MAQHRVVIAGGLPLFRAALKGAASVALPGAEILEVPSFDTLRRTLDQGKAADLIILDLQIPGATGLTALRYLGAKHPAVPVIVVLPPEDVHTTRKALDFGASGFILKFADFESFGMTLNTVLSGGIAIPRAVERQSDIEAGDGEMARRLSTLTPQQLKVFLLLGEGRSTKYIEARLTITEATVKAHVTGILRKLRVERRMQAAVLAQQLMQKGQLLGAIALNDTA